MTNVASICQGFIMFFKAFSIPVFQALFQAVDIGIHGFNQRRFFFVFLEVFDIFQHFGKFVYFKIRQRPIFVFTGKPQLRVVALYLFHLFAKFGFVAFLNNYRKAIDLFLQRHIRITASLTGKKAGDKKHKTESFAAP